MVATHIWDLNADQIEIRFGTDHPIPLRDLRSFFAALDRTVRQSDLFEGTVELGLAAVEPGSIRLVFGVLRRYKSRAIKIGRRAHHILDQAIKLDNELEKRIHSANERVADATERQAAAAERQADAAEKQTKIQKQILLTAIAAILVPVIVDEIANGELTAAIQKIDEQFDLTNIVVGSAANLMWIDETDLPDKLDVERVRARKRSEREEQANAEAERELAIFHEAMERKSSVRTAGWAREINGEPWFETMNGNKYLLDDRRHSFRNWEAITVEAFLHPSSRGPVLEIEHLITRLDGDV